MYNWSTDTTKFKNKTDRRLWEITQMLNYGIGDSPLSETELKTVWLDIKYRLDPAKRRAWEYALWGKLYSLETNKKFWQPLTRLPLPKIST
jgi:hypothetical protein